MTERIKSRELIGKLLVSEESGKKFGVIGDLDFVTDSGELMNVILSEKTPHVDTLNVPKDDKSRFLIPFSAVKSVGDFVIVSEKDII